MKKLNLHSKAAQTFVQIPVDFIDTYLPEAPEEALKVYLYLLRSSLDPSIILSLQDMADLFDVTPKKIVQALAYWESLSVLSLEYTDGEISDVTLLPVSEKQAALSAQDTAPKAAPEAPKQMRQDPPANITPLRADTSPALPVSLDNPAVQDLTELAQCYLKKPVSSAMCEAIAISYATLSCNEELCEYLLEYCIERGHTSPHYLKAVAEGWAKEQFKDVAEAKNAVANRDKGLFAIMKELGLGSREPAPSEADTIRTWLATFELPVVTEACRRTIAKTHEPNFRYVSGILSDWKEHGVTSLQDIETLDRQYQEQKAAAPSVNTKKNSFHNGMEHDIDYDSLMKRLVES